MGISCFVTPRCYKIYMCMYIEPIDVFEATKPSDFNFFYWTMWWYATFCKICPGYHSKSTIYSTSANEKTPNFSFCDFAWTICFIKFDLQTNEEECFYLHIKQCSQTQNLLSHPSLGDFMFSVRIRRRVRVRVHRRRRRNDFCFSRQNRLSFSLDIRDKGSIGLGKYNGWPFVEQSLQNLVAISLLSCLSPD